MLSSYLGFALAPYLQKALVELLLLAVIGGVLGSWIVLRRLAFYTHGVGVATFPGLVIAGPWGIPAQLAALGTALLFAGGQQRLNRSRRIEPDAATGLLLVGFLVAGTILASNVFRSGGEVDRLLFGTLIGITEGELLFTAAVAAVVLLVNAFGKRIWLASGFDEAGARASGLGVGVADLVLLGVVALAVVVAVDAVGALLVGAIFVIPAATVRLLTNDLRTLQLGSVGVAALEGVVALWLAKLLNIGPGPVLAVLGGVLFAAVAVGSRVRLAIAQ